MPAARTKIAVKRVYDPPAKSDGTRILVDRLWPRGLTKADAKIDLWLRDLAPSNELRKWIHSHATVLKDFIENRREAAGSGRSKSKQKTR